MKALASVFAEAGCEDVRTYIQSGNVLFRGKISAPVLERRIEDTFGFAVSVVHRPASALARIAAVHPFADRTNEPKLLYVGCCKDRPVQRRLADSPSPDDLVLVHAWRCAEVKTRFDPVARPWDRSSRHFAPPHGRARRVDRRVETRRFSRRPKPSYC